MSPKIDYRKESPEAVAALHQLERHLQLCGLESSLLELVKTRASQINGCAFCLDMHTKEARHAGESEQRLYTLSAWRETPFFSARERAALAFTEAVTRIAQHRDGEVLEDELRREFSDKEIVDLTFAIVAINAWNRLSITFQTPVGSYQRPLGKPAARD